MPLKDLSCQDCGMLWKAEHLKERPMGLPLTRCTCGSFKLFEVERKPPIKGEEDSRHVD